MTFYVAVILNLIEVAVFCYFVYVVGYTLFFAITGLLYRTPKTGTSDKSSTFCVFIPSYREDSIILETAEQALRQSYPQTHYRVVVIADSLQADTLQKLRAFPIDVVEVSFDKSTKVKSLNKAFERVSNYDFAVILDADNVMAFDFLEKMNALIHSKGYQAVQGQRKPKNQNTALAVLDGISESINNHVYRQGTVVPGLSSSISGSGVAFEFSLLKSRLATMDSVGGFDRELELLLLRDGISVRYYREAIVYDEKVSEARAFGNQRRRWISSQYIYLGKYFKEGMRALFRGDFAFFNSAVLRNVQLPRLLNLGIFTALIFILFPLRQQLFIPYTGWLGLFLIYCTATLASIPSEFYNWKLLQSLFYLPVIFGRMAILMFRLKGANKKFIHTPHGVPANGKKSKPIV